MRPKCDPEFFKLFGHDLEETGKRYAEQLGMPFHKDLKDDLDSLARRANDSYREITGLDPKLNQKPC